MQRKLPDTWPPLERGIRYMVFALRGSEQVGGLLPAGLQTFLLCVWAVTLLLSACSRPVDSSRNVTVEHAISPEPARVGPVIVSLRLADKAGRPLSGARIALEANMSHAGMAPAFGKAGEIESGRYQGGLRFEMAGDWIVLLHITLPGGQKLERQIDVRGVRPN